MALLPEYCCENENTSQTDQTELTRTPATYIKGS